MIVSFTDFTMKLAQGQLKNTALVDDVSTGEINPAQEDQILGLTNQGLIDIFTKKKILEGREILTLVPGQNIYSLDTNLVFTDFIRTMQVEAVLKGYSLVEANKRVFVPKSNKHVTAPSITTLRFSDAFLDSYQNQVDVVYQKRHPEITAIDDINIPDHLLEVLILYVAGLYLSHMGGEENTAKGDNYYGLFLKKMGEDEINNSSGTSELLDEDTRFYDRGFV